MRMALIMGASMVMASFGVLTAAPVAAQSIAVGQTIRSELSASDPQWTDGTHFDCWVFDAPAGAYTVDLMSEDFDANLGVGKGSDCTADLAASNDDANLGTDSHLEFATDGGPWFIFASTYAAGEVGDYQLRLVAGGNPGLAEFLTPAWQVELYDREGGTEHLVNVLCAALDTIDLVRSLEALSEQERDTRIAKNDRYASAAFASGAGLGFSREQVGEQISGDVDRFLVTGGDLAASYAECPAL